LRTFDFDLKSKEFKDSKTLVNNRIESEGTFIDYQWIMRKGHCYLLVLSSNNTYRLFTDDFTTDPIEVKFGQIQKKVTLIHVAKNIARDVDDTFGFGNLSPEKGEKEQMNQDEARDPNFNAGVRFKQVDGKLPSDFTSTALAASSEGFIVAGTGGIILFFRASEPTKHRESRKEMFALTNAYQMSNIKEDSRITYVSTDTRMRMLTLIVQTDVERMYYTLSDQTVGEEEIRLEKFFPAGYHNCKVYSISMSRARSIFVTSGQDEVIRIWAYDKINGGDKRAILEAPKQENPVSVSLHPLGFFLAVAFSSGFKVYALLQDNFFLLKETNIIHCSIVRYSTRGQYLLASSRPLT
jgi:WD40 repeat protein